MSRIVYVNGQYVPYAAACVHVEDRGFQFADGVYEVCELYKGCIVDESRHLERLQRSLKELQFTQPMSLNSLRKIMRETIRKNRVKNGLLYLQITRGQSRRDFVFPPDSTPQTVVCMVRPTLTEKEDLKAQTGISVITTPDLRWKRVDIKSVALLPSALARQKAKDNNAQEAWLVDENGFVTEGAASNAWIVDQNGCLKTRHADFSILRGVTRTVVFDLIRKNGWDVVEEPFKVDEAKQAREAFITAASTIVMPVVKIDGTRVGDGRPGPITQKLREIFHTEAELSS